MDYVVLARKLRPTRFADLIGQETVVRALLGAIRADRIAHAFLFTGSRGVGKTSTARILTKALNCQQPQDGEPCNTCRNCTEITRNASPDVYEIDAASNRGIDNIRELRDNTGYVPVNCTYKTYIIDEVHMLTTESFNALLKTLEEPPPHVKFILATTSPHRIPDTILSRCQRFDFARISVPVLADYLERVTQAEGLGIGRGALESIARNAEGGVRDALTAVDQVVAFAGKDADDEAVRNVLGLGDHQETTALLEAILDKSLPAALEAFNTVRAHGHDLNVLLEALISEVKDCSLYLSLEPEGADGARALLADRLPQSLALYEARRDKVTLDELQQLFYLLLEVESQLKRSEFAQACFEMGLVKACRIQPLVGVPELLAQARRLAAPASGPSASAHARAAAPAREPQSQHQSQVKPQVQSPPQSPSPAPAFTVGETPSPAATPPASATSREHQAFGQGAPHPREGEADEDEPQPVSSPPVSVPPISSPAVSPHPVSPQTASHPLGSSAPAALPPAEPPSSEFQQPVQEPATPGIAAPSPVAPPQVAPSPVAPPRVGTVSSTEPPTTPVAAPPAPEVPAEADVPSQQAEPAKPFAPSQASTEAAVPQPASPAAVPSGMAAPFLADPPLAAGSGLPARDVDEPLPPEPPPGLDGDPWEDHGPMPASMSGPPVPPESGRDPQPMRDAQPPQDPQPPRDTPSAQSPQVRPAPEAPLPEPSSVEVSSPGMPSPSTPDPEPPDPAIPSAGNPGLPPMPRSGSGEAGAQEAATPETPEFEDDLPPGPLGPALCDDPRWRSLVEQADGQGKVLGAKLRRIEIAALEPSGIVLVAADPSGVLSATDLATLAPLSAACFTGGGDAGTFPIRMDDDTKKKARPAHTIAGRNRIEERNRIEQRRQSAEQDTQVQRLLRTFPKAKVVKITLSDTPNRSEDV